MSTVGTTSGSLATTLPMCGGKKWMTRLGGNGISRSGAGAPTASGLKKSLALRTRARVCVGTGDGETGMMDR